MSCFLEQPDILVGMPPQPLIPASAWRRSNAPVPLASHPKSIQALIRRLRTPLQVQAWLHSLRYNSEQTMHTLPHMLRRNRAHCLEAAMAAAAILEHHGYPPLILDLESTDFLDHTLFLYRQAGRYGTVGMSRDVGLYGRRPTYVNLHALVQSYAAPYIDAHAAIKGYGVLDLRTLTRDHWRNSPRSVWFVEDALCQNHHRRFDLTPEFIRTWRRRYTEFRRTHPNDQPSFYPNQHQWV